jgi:hypothetical protein
MEMTRGLITDDLSGPVERLADRGEKVLAGR